MRKIICCFLLLSTITAFLSVSSRAQNPPCWPEYNSLTFRVPDIEFSPPITLSMPYDVIIGYLALDTIRKGLSYKEFDNFLARQTYNDTMKYIMKYFYKMQDYDPIKYYLTLYYNEKDYLFPREIHNSLTEKIKMVSPYSYLDNLLFKSSIIAHVLVKDTFRIIDPTSTGYPEAMIVTCEVLDTIKGKIFPICNDYSNYTIRKENLNQRTLINIESINNCLQFEFRTKWERGNEYSRQYLVDSLDIPWIKKDKEYLVFLRLGIICSDSANYHIDLCPFIDYSLTCNMYPIVDGILYDYGNELGFGTELPISQIKSLIENRINEIINYSGE